MQRDGCGGRPPGQSLQQTRRTPKKGTCWERGYTACGRGTVICGTRPWPRCSARSACSRCPGGGPKQPPACHAAGPAGAATTVLPCLHTLLCIVQRRPQLDMLVLDSGCRPPPRTVNPRVGGAALVPPMHSSLARCHAVPRAKFGRTVRCRGASAQ
jgi:hypothetical protein